MKVSDIMTESPACCTPETSLTDVAKTMCEHDCGELPVVKGEGDLEPVGVITDRDIVCRALAKGKEPTELSARHCMTSPAFTVRPDADIKECSRLLEQKKIRRALVVDENGKVCGIVSQADVARRCEPKLVSEVVREISQPVAV